MIASEVGEVGRLVFTYPAKDQPEMSQDRLSLLCPDKAAQPGPAEQTEQSEPVLTPQRWTNRGTGTGDGQSLI